jgi:hypothetical protein
MWICKNCLEEVEDNFDICWNCNFDTTNNPPNCQYTEEQKPNPITPKNALKKTGINAAGKSLKKVVYNSILLILFTTIAIVISVTSKDIKVIKSTYIFLAILHLIGNILILTGLFKAGNHLENYRG